MVWLDTNRFNRSRFDTPFVRSYTPYQPCIEGRRLVELEVLSYEDGQADSRRVRVLRPRR